MPSKSRIITSVLGSLLLFALIAKLFFVDYYTIPQNGMYPGLPAGSRLFAAKHPYSSVTQVKRGDVVIFVREQNGARYNYIWRVVGLPGDTIAATGESLVVNGLPVSREHLRDEADTVVYRERSGDASYDVAFLKSPKDQPPDVLLTVPADQLFVMGDNRFAAVDSRFFGPINFKSIIARKF